MGNDITAQNPFLIYTKFLPQSTVETSLCPSHGPICITTCIARIIFHIEILESIWEGIRVDEDGIWQETNEHQS